ncbi:cytochrome b/b6 domain-containing protein [Thalassotalea montiporae]
MTKFKVWDNFTRIYHMSQLILLALLWYSGEQGDFDLHFICGYTMLALWISRLFWGIFGSQTSRFSYFLASPVSALRWLAKPHQAFPGHNPLAAYMIIALLLSLGVQLISGLFATDDVLAEGPLIYGVSDSLAETLDSLHNSNFDILLGLIAIHIVAALVHSWRGDNVIKTIITGYSNHSHSVQLRFRSSWIPIALWLSLFLLFGYLWLGDDGF